MTFKIYTDANAAYADVQAGNLDVMDTVPSADSKTFEFDSSVVPYNKAGSVIQTFTIPSDLDGGEEGRAQLRVLRISRIAPSLGEGLGGHIGAIGELPAILELDVVLVVRQLSKNSALSPNRDASVSRSARFRLWDDNPDVISNRRMII